MSFGSVATIPPCFGWTVVQVVYGPSSEHQLVLSRLRKRVFVRSVVVSCVNLSGRLLSLMMADTCLGHRRRKARERKRKEEEAQKVTDGWLIWPITDYSWAFVHMAKHAFWLRKWHCPLWLEARQSPTVTTTTTSMVRTHTARRAIFILAGHNIIAGFWMYLIS